MLFSQVKKTCVICNKEFSISKYRQETAKTCSPSCRGKYVQLIHPSLRKKLPHKFGVNHPNWHGGRWIDPKGYVHLRLPNYPQSNVRGYYREHRYVMEQSIGRFLEQKEHVHHINGDKMDNRIENLMLFKNSKEHAKHHVSLNGQAHP